MSLLDFLLGRPLKTKEDKKEKVNALEGIPLFGLDALGSVAYGPEAALTIFIGIGLLATQLIFPIIIVIAILTVIVYISYTQIIKAYPSGGGAYIVANQNLGKYPGLLAGIALLIDYILVAAVGISAGVGALISVIPALQPHTMLMCLFILIVMTIVNLRGAQESSKVFAFPTFLFVFSLIALVIAGLYKVFFGSGVQDNPELSISESSTKAASLWLILRAFAAGCTAMTGVEAVSNGVPAFKEPKSKNAIKSLTVIIAVLVILLLGIGYLCKVYGITATKPGQSGYESVLSHLSKVVIGKNWFYYIIQISILLALSFQANTAFSGFPRLCKVIATDGYLPSAFINKGRRLVYSYGIIILSILSGILIIIFNGVTDKLIPLFAIGAFAAFTMSQAGMAAHWIKNKDKHSYINTILNIVGASATGLTLLIIIAAKFSEGAWITLFLIAGMLVVMLRIKRHYLIVQKQISGTFNIPKDYLKEPIIVVPVEEWNKITHKAIITSQQISKEVIVLHIKIENAENKLNDNWKKYIEEPSYKLNQPVPKLQIIYSPYRFVIAPILEYVLDLEKKSPQRQIAVLIPMLIEKKWYNRFLHNNTAELLSALMLLKGDKRIMIINMPWYLGKSKAT